MQYTVIYASKEQVEKLYNKHLKPFIGIPKIMSKTYSYYEEDDIGFVELYTISGKKISYQLRNDKPMFVECTGFGDIRYDISYPEQFSQEMYDLLKKYGIKTQIKFWKGRLI